jgi:ribonuclease P protein component
LGVVVSKRIVRHAVERNHIKRLVREAFRRHQESLCAFDMVILARSPEAGTRAVSAILELTDLFQKLVRSPGAK